MKGQGNPICFFVSDLHGKVDRYNALFQRISVEKPRAVFLGGDLLPGSAGLELPGVGDFIQDFLIDAFCDLWRPLENQKNGRKPPCFLILGNDDPRSSEPAILQGEREGAWQYVYGHTAVFDGHPVYGYPFVPPTPFGLKDWERYDVSRFVDPGCLHPEEGYHTVDVDPEELRERTILGDLTGLGPDLESAIMLFHAPPYKTLLDRAALDGMMFDYVPLDLFVGSIAIQRFITQRQPLLTLHGHVHESARITGSWRDRIGVTHCFSAAHDGPELALVRFDPDDLDSASRELISSPI